MYRFPMLFFSFEVNARARPSLVLFNLNTVTLKKRPRCQIKVRACTTTS
jgi:hypothetical protein